MLHMAIHTFVSCALLFPASAGVTAAFAPAVCPAGGVRLAGGTCANCPDGMVATVWPDRSGINCDYHQARPPISSPLTDAR